MASTEEERLAATPGRGVKGPCAAATQSNISLNAPQTIDSVAVVAGDRVLVKDQAAVGENGIYVAQLGDWSRATDWDADPKVVSGALVPVAGGSNAGLHQVTFSGEFSIGVTPLVWVKLA